eukprot:Plantae.Rhodophyta-Rhodochaete_pulchella.ctg692.p2 GENE.Plantae.Rhodophyta-Rhodochaete_pulchella.ctg692~~Plantae.Rhodophyta-Rhodochaete_pulchella.ctg692.p2  ORF type:complete len:364 (-),score=50.33 Plantae.Rhodophyta-Rhodochaete_pulchella.ctg692:1159-2250(-)
MSGLSGLLPTVAAYALCSSTLLVANKWALELMPKANVLMFLQLFTSFAIVGLGVALGLIKADKLEVEKIKRFIPVVLIFYAVLWSNLRALEALGVDMVILFRSLTPFAISVGDYLYLGRSMPSLQSWFALAAMALCTAFIFVREPRIDAQGLMWGVLYYVILSVDMVYLKKITVDVKLTTNGRVLYTNLLASVPALFVAITFGELTDIGNYATNTWSPVGLAVACTCVLGFGMSYLSWALRAKVSALTFVVIGILCKIGSVVINALYMKQHLSTQSMVLVCLGIMASTLYEQPKARQGQRDVNKDVSEKDEEESKSKGDVALKVSDKAEDEAKRSNRIPRGKVALMVGLTVAILVTHYADRFG